MENLKNGLILFVDDEYYLLQTLRAIFRRELRNYQLEFFTNGEEALEFLKSIASVQIGKMVVLSDWHMPMMRGDDLLVQVHKLFPNSKNFLLSGMINKEPDPGLFEKAGIVKVISKPWENDYLTQLIKSHL
jgi:response regulator RpfG family c-di-GMP phosphodiesterase